MLEVNNAPSGLLVAVAVIIDLALVIADAYMFVNCLL